MCSKIDVSKLSVDEQSERAFERILRVVNKREVSSEKMRSRLVEAGFCEEAIKSSLERAIECRYIDDRRYSECLIRTTLSSGKGLSHIEYEIKALGIDLYDLESYQIYLSEGQDAQLQRALDVLDRHLTRSKDLYSSCFRKLISRGFSPSVAKQAVKIHLGEPEVI